MTEQFFELVRSGLWNKPADASLFNKATDWQAIYQLARKQTVLGLVFDGINTLPSELHPARTLYLQWCRMIAEIEDANKQLDNIIAELYPAFIEAGLCPILLKGQGIAGTYANPSRRQCGDIDIYFGKQQYAQANQMMVELGASGEPEESVKHTSFEYRQVQIEIHRSLAYLYDPFIQKEFNKIEQRYLSKASLSTTTIANTDVNILHPTFNVIYIFIHALVHFLSSGVGLRQLCDWARLIATTGNELNNKEIEESLRKMKLEKAVGAFAYVAVNYLGLPAEKIPFTVLEAKAEGEYLLKDIFVSGNFGQYNASIPTRPKGFWPGKWHTFKLAMRRSNELKQFSSGMTFWYTFFLIKTFIQTQWKRLLKRLKN